MGQSRMVVQSLWLHYAESQTQVGGTAFNYSQNHHQAVENGNYFMDMELKDIFVSVG